MNDPVSKPGNQNDESRPPSEFNWDEFNCSPGTTLFQRYIIKKRISKGEIGEAYLVTDIVMEKDFVLKVILPRLFFKDEKSVDRFLREARISCDLHHPNIVNVYDIGKENSVYYLKMEYIIGSSLNEWLELQAKPIPLFPILLFGMQLCDALEYAYQRGIVHRDIKPGNIIITDDNQIKLLDFGIPRIIAYKDRTSFGVVPGSIDYMAPECYSDPDRADIKTEIYSLGAIIYALLVGTAPIGRIALPSAYRTDIPSDLDRAIDKALCNNPDNRYQTAIDFKKALQEIFLLVTTTKRNSDTNLDPQHISPPHSISNNEPVQSINEQSDKIQPEKIKLEEQSHDIHKSKISDADLVKSTRLETTALVQQGNIIIAIAIWEKLLQKTLCSEIRLSVEEEINRLKKVRELVEQWKLIAIQAEAQANLKKAWECWNEVLELTPRDQSVRENIKRLESRLPDQLPDEPTHLFPKVKLNEQINPTAMLAIFAYYILCALNAFHTICSGLMDKLRCRVCKPHKKHVGISDTSGLNVSARRHNVLILILCIFCVFGIAVIRVIWKSNHERKHMMQESVENSIIVTQTKTSPVTREERQPREIAIITKIAQTKTPTPTFTVIYSITVSPTKLKTSTMKPITTSTPTNTSTQNPTKTSTSTNTSTQNPTKTSTSIVTSTPTPTPVKLPSELFVIMETSLGTIELELFPQKAPISVKNFITYVNENFYVGTIFHRVIPGFMIQGGGMTADMKEKPTHAAIKNEAGNGLQNTRGTISMARTGVVDSATVQFFINLVDNRFLDHKNETPQGFGYAVFGKVTAGMNVVDKIASVRTSGKPPHQDVPVEPVIIKSVKIK